MIDKNGITEDRSILSKEIKIGIIGFKMGDFVKELQKYLDQGNKLPGKVHFTIHVYSINDNKINLISEIEQFNKTFPRVDIALSTG